MFSLWDEPKKKTIPKKLLRRSVWERDKGICQICHRPVDQFDWELGHNRARSHGGKFTIKNTFVVHPSCNRSQQTLTLKETRRLIGGPLTEEEKAKQVLNGLPMVKLKHLAKKHDIVLRSKTVESFWEKKVVPPSKRQYVNALARVMRADRVKSELRSYKPPQVKRRKKKDDWSLF
jgi:hypothetical protein